MRTYTAHLKPSRPPLLRREGWSWPAFLFGPLWLAAERAWIPAILELAAFALSAIFFPPALPGLVLLNGLLGQDLVRWSLARRGYTLAHVVAAPDPDAALLRLLAARPDLGDHLR